MRNILLCVIFWLGVVWVFAHCDSNRSVCSDIGAWRCVDNTTQVCDNDGQWFDVADCSTLYFFDGDTSIGSCEENIDGGVACLPSRDLNE